MKSIVVGFAVFTLLSACQRATDNTTRMTIALPYSSPALSLNQGLSPLTNNSGSTASISSSGATTNPIAISEEDDVDRYLQATPSFSATGFRPVNCYMVAIGGPEVAMRLNRCIYKGSLNSAKKRASFGTYIGLKPSGTSLSLDVPSGDSRDIQIYAYHSTTPNGCLDLALNPIKANLTHPYLVGRTAPMTFEPGKEITVNVNMEEPSDDNEISECLFATNGDLTAVATTAAIRTDRFPYATLTKNGVGRQCDYIDVDLISNTKKMTLGILPVAFTGNIVDGNNGDQKAQVYNSYDACKGIAPSTPPDEFTIAAGDSTARVWIPVPSLGSSPKLRVVDTGKTGLAEIEETFQVITSNTELLFDMPVPNKLAPDICYNFRASYRHAYGMPLSLSGNSTSSTVTLTGDNGDAGNRGSFYNGVDCNGGPTTSISLSSTSATSVTQYFSVKIDSANIPAGTNFVHLNMSSSTLGPATVKGFSAPIKYDATITPDPLLTRIRVLASNKLFLDNVVNTICLPVTVQFQDQRGFPINAISTDTYQVVAGSVSPVNTKFYGSETECRSGTGGEITPGTDIPAIGGLSQQTFYVRMNAVVRAANPSFKVRVNADLTSAVKLSADGS